VSARLLKVIDGGRVRDCDGATRFGPETPYKGNWWQALQDLSARERFAREVRQGQHFQVVSGQEGQR
jgi:hypothetical protein